MSADGRIAEIAASWWQMACDDLTVAGRARDLPSVCAFHAQQAVEKALKTLLVLHQIEFEKSHNIGNLLGRVRGSPTVPPDALLSDLPPLTRFAVETRYPPAAATPQEAADALGAAERFLAWVEAALPPEVTSPGG